MNNTVNWKLALSIFVLISVVSYALWSIYNYGRYRAGFDRIAEKKERRVLQQTIEKLEDQIADYRARVVRFESSKKVDQYAKDAVEETLARNEAESQELREELEFYRTIVSPSKGRQGMHIHDFQLTQGLKGGYNYSLTVIHIQGPRKHHRQSDGKIKMSVEGKQSGVVKKLGFANISSKKRSSIRYRFKYFAHFEGKLSLPKDFRPQTVEIEIIPRQKSITGDSKKIKWPVGVS